MANIRIEDLTPPTSLEVRGGLYVAPTTSTAADFVLDWPNDGTSENKYSTLADSANGGHTKAWCHTTGMSYIPQTSNGG